MYLMVGAFREFQQASRYPKQITPDLSVNFHKASESIGGRLFVGKKVVDLACRVIDEVNHGEGNGGLSVGSIEMSSVASGLMALKECAADDRPDHGGICAALSRSVYGIECAMSIEVVGDARDGL
jgi:hypothetical protein